MKQPEVTRFKDIIKEKTGKPAEKMVSDVYQKQGRQLFLEREHVRRSISTIDAWQAEQARVREAFLKAIGGSLPNEDVKIQYCGEIRKKNVLIKKLLFSPFGDHWVSANLYLPLNRKGKVPVVVLPHGHGLSGKTGNRKRAVWFAANGYAAFAFDYVGGGERNLLDKNGDIITFASTQHNIAGNRMKLYAYNLQWFMIAETIAAVDVISMQPEIDSDKICMTGSSGGGTETFFTTALDSRIKVSAPAACIRSYCGEIEVDDTEQVLFNPIPAGLGYPDIASFLTAPRPMLIVANKKDIWSFDQVEYFIHEVASFYKLHGVEEKFSQTIWDRGHKYEEDQVEVAIKWFNRWLGNQAAFVPADNIDEADVPTETECLATEKGSLFLSGFSTPIRIFSEYTKQKYGSLSPVDKETIETFVTKNFPSVEVEGQIEWELIDTYQIGDILGKRILFSPEAGMWLPAEILIPPTIKKAVVLLDEIPRMMDIEWQLEYASSGCLTIRPDMRGFGDTEDADSWSDIETWAQNVYAGKRYRLAALAQTVGRNIMIDRARDVSALIDVLTAMGHEYEIGIHGKRTGALIGMFAALGDQSIKSLVLENSLSSWREHVAAKFPLSWGDEMVYGILRKGIDISDIKKYLVDHRKLKLKEEKL